MMFWSEEVQRKHLSQNILWPMKSIQKQDRLHTRSFLKHLPGTSQPKSGLQDKEALPLEGCILLLYLQERDFTCAHSSQLSRVPSHLRISYCQWSYSSHFQ